MMMMMMVMVMVMVIVIRGGQLFFIANCRRYKQGGRWDVQTPSLDKRMKHQSVSSFRPRDEDSTFPVPAHGHI